MEIAYIYVAYPTLCCVTLFPITFGTAAPALAEVLPVVACRKLAEGNDMTLHLFLTPLFTL